LGLGGMFNGINGAPMIGGLGMSMATSTPVPNNCGLAMGSVGGGTNAHHMFTSQAAGVPGLDTCNNVAASSSAVAAAAAAAAASGGNSLFGPVGSAASGMSGINMNHGGFGSPTGRRGTSDRLTMPDGPVFDPFRRSSPSLGSPGTASSGAPQLPVNNNSFGLGTVLNSPTSLRKSPTPTEQAETQTKIEVEIGDNIVGAILGHGGKSLVEIQRISGANVQISKKGIFVPGTRNRIVTITGTQNAVSTAQYLIEQQINEEEAKRARQNPTTICGGLR